MDVNLKRLCLMKFYKITMIIIMITMMVMIIIIMITILIIFIFYEGNTKYLIFAVARRLRIVPFMLQATELKLSSNV